MVISVCDFCRQDYAFWSLAPGLADMMLLNEDILEDCDGLTTEVVPLGKKRGAAKTKKAVKYVESSDSESEEISSDESFGED